MSEQKYSNEQFLKVMLEVAQRKRSLTNLEEKYYSSIDSVSESRKSEIISEMVKNCWISSHPVFFDQPQTASNTSVKIFPMQSSDGEGLSQKGEDKLEDLIKILEKEKEAKRNQFIMGFLNFLKSSFGWIMGIIAAVIAGYILWKMGWI